MSVEAVVVYKGDDGRWYRQVFLSDGRHITHVLVDGELKLHEVIDAYQPDVSDIGGLDWI